MSTAGDGDPPSVVHVVPAIGDRGQFGGPTTVAVGLVGELSRRGWRAEIVSVGLGAIARPPEVPRSGWFVSPARRVVPRSGMLGLLSARYLSTLWRRFGAADLAHLHAGRDLVTLSALVVARLRRVPVVAQTHGMVGVRSALAVRAFDVVFLGLLRRVATVLYLTDDEHRDLTRLLGPRTRLRFLSNGLPTPPDPTDSLPGDPVGRPPRVVFAARLSPVKRVLTFAEAARVLLARGVDADFVVHGPDQGDLVKLRELLRDPALRGRLSYGGALSHAQTQEALRAASVYVLPSSADWMPMSLLEAMSYGVPTVSNWSCGLSGLISQARAGLVTDGSVDEIAAAIGQLLNDQSLARQVSLAGVELIRSRFSIDAVVDELESVYTEARMPAVTSATTRSRPL